MSGQPATNARKIERLREQAAEVLRALRELVPGTHLKGQLSPDATWTETRDSWRHSLASAAETVLNLGGLVDALAAKANGNAPQFNDEQDCDFALEVLDDLGVEFPHEIKRERDRHRNELIRSVGPERIRKLWAEYPGDAGEKPLRNEEFCRWAVEQIKSGQRADSDAA